MDGHDEVRELPWSVTGDELDVVGVPPPLVSAEGHERALASGAGFGADSHARSIAKAVSYRVISSLLITVFAWVFTRQIRTAVAIGVGDAILKITLFYVHERLWTRIPFGRAPPPDYQI
jgi:uncharacterized membrane protein